MRNWVHLPKPGVSPSTGIWGLWVDAQSKPSVYIQSDGLYTLEPSGWVRTLKSPGLPDEAPLQTEFFEPVLRNSTGIYRWTPESAWTPIASFAEPRSYLNAVRDSLGRLWVFQNDTVDLAMIHGFSFQRVPLRADAGSKILNIFSRKDGMVVATNLGLLQRKDADTEWALRSWQDWGLGAIDRIHQIDDHTLILSVRPDSKPITGFWVLDLVTQTKKFWPAGGTFYSFNDVRKTSKGEIIMALDFSIYRTDGVSYAEIFSQKDLNSLPQIPGTFLLIFAIRIDANDRLWFHIATGLVRIDL
ncbi:MAG TPA: hypothetical protein VE954_25605 [Oligoflexus sp.]|uniref:hypothetical protein n=1 Tax=Oligoflexus sp. TaxID=1971216 RepID=UPI002D684709|nr:hypothetical protein [Oligoflexus sp.]HYX36498.1 hypothetical protein [Oligoflexus sp.]